MIRQPPSAVLVDDCGVNRSSIVCHVPAVGPASCPLGSARAQLVGLPSGRLRNASGSPLPHCWSTWRYWSAWGGLSQCPPIASFSFPPLLLLTNCGSQILVPTFPLFVQLGEYRTRIRM